MRLTVCNCPYIVVEAYPNLLGKKGYVVVAYIVVELYSSECKMLASLKYAQF